MPIGGSSYSTGNHEFVPPREYRKQEFLSELGNYLDKAYENYEKKSAWLKKLSNFPEQAEYVNKLRLMLDEDSSPSDIMKKIKEGEEKFNFLTSNQLRSLLSDYKSRLVYWVLDESKERSTFELQSK